MTAPRFGAGSGTGLLSRLRTQRVDVGDLRDTAEALLPCLTGPGLLARLQERPHRGSVVVLVPYWLAGPERAALGAAVRAALAGAVHPVAAIHLQDVLTELHVAAARDTVWPASAARVRSATGWADDVLPVRLSAAERACVLALPGLPDTLGAALAGGRA